MTSMFGAMHS